MVLSGAQRSGNVFKAFNMPLGEVSNDGISKSQSHFGLPELRNTPPDLTKMPLVSRRLLLTRAKTMLAMLTGLQAQRRSLPLLV